MAPNLDHHLRFIPRIVAIDLQNNSSLSFSLGNEQNITLALTQSQLSLPDPETVIQSSYNLGFPQVIAFATACIGLYLGIRFIRSFTP